MDKEAVDYIFKILENGKPLEFITKAKLDIRFQPSEGCDHRYVSQPHWENWECIKCHKKVKQ